MKGFTNIKVLSFVGRVFRFTFNYCICYFLLAKRYMLGWLRNINIALCFLLFSRRIILLFSIFLSRSPFLSGGFERLAKIANGFDIFIDRF